MFGEKVIELLKESERNRDTIDQYNDEKVRQIIEEMHVLFKMNMADAPKRKLRLERNYREQVSLDNGAGEAFRFGKEQALPSSIPSQSDGEDKNITLGVWVGTSPDVRELLSDNEYEWFTKYSTNLATYMRSLGRDIGYSGIDLTENLRPPKSLYVEVLCLTDYGKLELEDGDVVLLKKHSRHFLPTSECQTLIHRGILKQIT